MTDTFRALCAELANHLQGRKDLECGWGEEDPEQDLLDRARAALAQPEPQGPTDEELCQILHQAICDFPPTHPDALNLDARQYEIALELHKARAALARWGRPTINPVPVAERPWEREGWCDAKGQCWMGDSGGIGFVPSWRLCKPSDSCLPWSLPHHALPVPTTHREEN